jgi:hypothetical protein
MSHLSFVCGRNGVGGSVETVDETLTARAIAGAMSSRNPLLYR